MFSSKAEGATSMITSGQGTASGNFQIGGVDPANSSAVENLNSGYRTNSITANKRDESPYNSNMLPKRNSGATL